MQTNTQNMPTPKPETIDRIRRILGLGPAVDPLRKICREAAQKASLTRFTINETFSKDPKLCRHYGQGETKEETVGGTPVTAIYCRSCKSLLAKFETGAVQ